MILAFALMAFDMFGQQIARIGDVTKDGVDEIVVTDPIGDTEKPREGRVLIVDPMKWTIVRELSGEASETQFGDLCSVARSGERSYLAVTSVVKGEPKALVRLIDAGDFSTVWKDAIELDPSKRAMPPNPLCVIDGDDPVVFLIERSKAAVDDPEHLVLWRRDLKGRTLVGHLRDGYLPYSGQNMCPHFDDKGKLDGIVVSSIESYTPPTTRLYFEQRSRIDWVDFGRGDSVPVCHAEKAGAAVGVAMLASSDGHGRFSAGAIATRRVGTGGGQLVLINRDGEASKLDLSAEGRDYYWGASMCWIRDLDDDGIEDLAVGCPVALGGSVLVLGSKSAGVVATVIPRALEGQDPRGLIEYASSFGTQVCAIADQDGDGKDDIVVAALTPGSFREAAVSVVSTRTWKIIRVVFERDLARAASPK